MICFANVDRCQTFSPEGAADGLMKALNDVLEDGRFKLPSAVASTATVSAVKLLEWASKDEDRAMLVSFAEETIAHLDTAFDSRMKQPHRQREKMWANYHKIRTSSNFLSRWSFFSNPDPHPASDDVDVQGNDTSAFPS